MQPTGLCVLDRTDVFNACRLVVSVFLKWTRDHCCIGKSQNVYFQPFGVKHI